MEKEKEKELAVSLFKNLYDVVFFKVHANPEIKCENMSDYQDLVHAVILSLSSLVASQIDILKLNNVAPDIMDVFRDMTLNSLNSVKKRRTREEKDKVDSDTVDNEAWHGMDDDVLSFLKKGENLC